MKSTPVLACESIVKQYGSTRAVNDVSISVQRGEVLALLGENGAGKSTLVKVLSGVVQPDSGTIRLSGEATTFNNARDAARSGIHLVHQELALLPERNITENIFLGQELKNRFGLLDWRTMRRMARTALDELGVDTPVDARVAGLSTAVQQMVEIARASVGEARVVVLDEPTAALSPADAERLFAVVEKMKLRGISFIYISHRLDEVKALADQIIVMKDGGFVAKHSCSELSIDQMVALMVGRELAEFYPDIVENPHASSIPVMEVQDLIDPPFIEQASLRISPGEVVGLYGLEGHGQDELLACLAGARKPFSGSLSVDGKTQKWGGVAAATEAGFGYVPEDRKTEGLVLEFSSIWNISLPILRKKLSRWGLFSQNQENSKAVAAAEASGIRGDILRPSSTLSGGNQQKVVLAKWIAAGTRILLLNQPTRGVDVGAKAEIYRMVRARCLDEGIVALVVSREISELQGFCDRILVMSYGRLVGEHPRTATEEEILATAVGGNRL
ncbi:hypothetical protein CQ018_05060 [Arthrobacter sp. MYb227]|uniref:sugar ABC transporter ATP-binding protein n=1 Tax=Arthrobacter sp. MYb227 TaxID=1848601 RepID=UPI000CFC0E07|nr:sugar ABC transporter ATP-binding protein [Arthrobacter sp. MYb227]PQZ94719.1 hypothetical protein CQ018_05060 [Arthrobacter sp. MYb227]